jgi:hypothetical protein
MGLCLHGDDDLRAKERSGILAQASAKAPEMMYVQPAKSGAVKLQ